MLKSLRFENVGPASEMAIEFGPRMNFLTGDNGLGKSFLLEVGWWAMTRTWARGLVLPHPPPAKGKISYSYTGNTGPIEKASIFNREAEHWPLPRARPGVAGLVIYAQVDGGFSVWDPNRNYEKKENPNRPAAFLFEPGQSRPTSTPNGSE